MTDKVEHWSVRVWKLRRASSGNQLLPLYSDIFLRPATTRNDFLLISLIWKACIINGNTFDKGHVEDGNCASNTDVHKNNDGGDLVGHNGIRDDNEKEEDNAG